MQLIKSSSDLTLSRFCYGLGKVLFAAFFVNFLVAASASAASVRLKWDPNHESDVTGYRVYLGTDPSALSQVAYVGNVLVFTFTGLTAGHTYYFAVSALNSSGGESDVSSIVPVTLPTELDTDGDGIPDSIDSDDDEDGLSDADENIIGTNILIADTDGDGVSDGQEVAQGSNPLDPSSSTPTYQQKVFTEWNGFFNRMWNIAELINLGNSPLGAGLTLFDHNGQVTSVRNFILEPGRQQDMLVHDIVGYTSDSAGSLVIGHNGSSGQLDGRMLYYKLASPKSAQLGKQFDFALSMPLSSGESGAQYVLFDTTQRSLAAADARNFVANWIQLSNLSAEMAAGTLRFYGISGNLLGSFRVQLHPGERFDSAAHSFGPNVRGLVEWAPDRSDLLFLMRNVRYYYDNANLIPSFTTAFQQEGTEPTGDTLIVPVTTESSLAALLDIANVSDTPVSFSIGFTDAGGKPILTPVKASVGGKAVWQFSFDKYLKGKKALAIIKSSLPGALLASVTEINRTATKSVAFMYGVLGRNASGQVLRGSYNNYLGQSSNVIIANPTATPQRTTYMLTASTRGAVPSAVSVLIPARGMKTFSVGGTNEYGIVTLIPDQANVLAAWVNRQKGRDYLLPTLVRE